MKVLEIKNNLVKIAYDTEDNLALSGFVIIEDKNNPYVAQVMNLKADSTNNFAIVKLLFTFDEEGILKNYNGTIPSLKASVSKLPSNELLDIIPIDEPLVIGTLAQQGIKLQVDKTILENNLLICSNNLSNTKTLLNNIIGQIDEKSIIIDTEGQFEDFITIGEDFKLPLNTDTINYIYENDLDDVDATSKAIIQDIFLEVQEYIKTLPEKFLPFDTFVSVIDSQYKESGLSQLILLKNKLLKYKEQNIFAQTLKDILGLSMSIDNEKSLCINLSNIDSNLQKEVIRYIYSVLTTLNENIYVFVKADNSNISKKLLKRYFDRDNIFTTIICPHEFRYIEEVKAASQNIIFFAPLTLQHDFASYNTYLNKLNNDEYVIFGRHTQHIPLITETNIIEEVQQENIFENSEQNNVEDFSNEINAEDVIETDESENDFPEEITYPEIIDNNEEFAEESIIEEPVIEEQVIEEDIPVDDEIISHDEIIDEQDEIQPEELNQIEPAANILDENYDDEIYSQDDIVEQVAKDVDKVFYEKLPVEDDIQFESEEQTENNEPFEEQFTEHVELLDDEQSEDLSEDDLNLIDDLTAQDDVQLIGNDEFPELENFEEEQPPVVPIYPAEELESSNEFEPGDHVSTPKYGEGVVERMIKYGNKMLCSIDFPNIGRRLLDPAITEITKL